MALRSLQSYTKWYFKVNILSLIYDTSSKKCWFFLVWKPWKALCHEFQERLACHLFPSDIQQTQETFYIANWNCICNNDYVRKAPKQWFNSLWIPVSFKSYWELECCNLLISVMSVPYLSHCSLFDQTLRNELCVLRIQDFPSFIWITFVCLMLVL